MASSEWRGPREDLEHGGNGGRGGGQPAPAQGEWRQGRVAYSEQGSEHRAPPADKWQQQAEYSGSAGARTPPNEKWQGVGEVSPGADPAPPKQRPPPRVLGQAERPVVSNMVEVVLTALSWLIVMAFFPLSMFACVRVVQEYERAIIFRLGRLHQGGAQGPGLFLVLPCLDKLTCVDLRVVSFDVAPQEILTKDLVTISVDAVVYFRIFEPIVSVTNVENSGYSTRLLAATSLRTVLGQYSLADILSQRECIAGQMQGVLDDATDAWGVKVERVEVKDVRLPQELQRAMAAEAEASREAKAKVIAAEGEMNASLSLKRAADIMATSPSALQLRYLQTLNTISAEKNSTIIFPVPIDILGGLTGALSGKAAKNRASGAGGDGGGGDFRGGGNGKGSDAETGGGATGKSVGGASGKSSGAEGGDSGGRVAGAGAGEWFSSGHSGGLGTRPRGGPGTGTSGEVGTGGVGAFGTGTSGGFDTGAGGGTSGSGASSNGVAVSILPGSLGVRV